MNFMKKMAAVLCIAVIVMAGVVVAPVTADAAGATVFYEACDIGKYWSKSQKTAPIKDGYVFGGWYTKTTEGETTVYTALKEADITTDENGVANVEDTYAKYVPAYVLSVKAQNESGTSKDDDKDSSVRVLSSVDCKDYQKVGFKILINNKNELFTGESGTEPLETTKVFTGLVVGTDTDNPLTPENIFGSESHFLSVWRLDGIANKFDAKIINVTPYWITMDGTKVEGLSKYVHVEDGYNGYISVPINLCDIKEVAAGTLTMTYPSGLTLVANKVEFDGVFPKGEMSVYDDGNGTIKIVGNADTVNTVKVADGIFANLRFTADESVYSGAGKGTFLSFTVIDEKFCDWDEELITIDAWDIKY